jgi:hypothetical protein
MGAHFIASAPWLTREQVLPTMRFLLVSWSEAEFKYFNPETQRKCTQRHRDLLTRIHNYALVRTRLCRAFIPQRSCVTAPSIFLPNKLGLNKHPLFLALHLASWRPGGCICLCIFSLAFRLSWHPLQSVFRLSTIHKRKNHNSANRLIVMI